MFENREDGHLTGAEKDCGADGETSGQLLTLAWESSAFKPCEVGQCLVVALTLSSFSSFLFLPQPHSSSSSVQRGLERRRVVERNARRVNNNAMS
ncbi:unnamed protein product [Allacma fusca]|uniref:Uncharacterized protein n=1 Tax=Allacma fusca TaxID=39272 RepID=A0A8J2L1W8_9HEXA|nr:unnamed protein product [Allacma fusca]